MSPPASLPPGPAPNLALSLVALSHKVSRIFPEGQASVRNDLSQMRPVTTLHLNGCL